MEKRLLEYWEVWYPQAVATGLPFARGKIDSVASMMLHSPPEVLTAEVRNEQGNRIAYGKDLRRALVSPMCRLRREGRAIVREDAWP